jgi:hypothetical protein
MMGRGRIQSGMGIQSGMMGCLGPMIAVILLALLGTALAARLRPNHRTQPSPTAQHAR